LHFPGARGGGGRGGFNGCCFSRDGRQSKAPFDQRGAARDARALSMARARRVTMVNFISGSIVCLSGRCCMRARRKCIPTIKCAISFFILLLLFCCMRREMRFEKFSFVSSRAAAELRPLQFSDDAMPRSSIFY
jgi:hypothetical protein